MTNKVKYPITDQEMKILLDKYPFLNYRALYDDSFCYETEIERIEHNYYKAWDGSGWEGLWKKYLSKLFAEYDTWKPEDQKTFRFCDTKEKFGELRIYTSFSSDKNLESIAESLSGYTCEFCGKEPRENGKRVIWTTNGWITNLCEDCAREYLKKQYKLGGSKLEDTLQKMKNIQEKPFGYIRYAKDKTITVTYKETGDGWLEVDTVKEEPREETHE